MMIVLYWGKIYLTMEFLMLKKQWHRLQVALCHSQSIYVAESYKLKYITSLERFADIKYYFIEKKEFVIITRSFVSYLLTRVNPLVFLYKSPLFFSQNKLLQINQ